MISLIIHRLLQTRRFGTGILVSVCLFGLLSNINGQTDRVSQLIANLKDSDSRVRYQAADALGEIHAILAVEPMIAALRDPDPLVRASAAKALGEIKDPRAIEPLISAIDKLDGGLDSDQSNFQETAILAVGKIQDPRSVGPLIAALLNDPSTDVRRIAAKTLGEIRDPRAIEPLIAVLGGAVPPPQKAGKKKPKADRTENPPVGFDLASANELLVRGEAASALGNIRDPRAVEPLIAFLKDEGASEEHPDAATSLGQIKDVRAVEPLIESLKKDSFSSRETAKALGEIRDPRAVEPLIAVLENQDQVIQNIAIESLGEIGAPAVDPLISALRDTNPTVRMNATVALGKITDPHAEDTFQATLGELATIVENRNYITLIAKGAPGSEDVLIDALNQFGDEGMATDYLNCGNPKLADAGAAWGARHGLRSEAGYGGSSVSWGSMK